MRVFSLFSGSLAFTAVTAATAATEVINKDNQVGQYHDPSWLKENIPFIDIPDNDIQNVYYYRWSVLQRHLYSTYAGNGYAISEFMQPVTYAQRYGSINAAAGHMLNEARWLKDTRYCDDFFRLWTRGGGNNTQYTHWIHDAGLNHAMVTGDVDILIDQLNEMVTMYELWKRVYDEDNSGLYYYTTNWDAQEYSLTGYVTGEQTGVEAYIREGPDTFRPSLNGYMVANARAIAKVAEKAGNNSIKERYTQHADSIENSMYKYLWDDEQQFFQDVVAENNTALKPIKGRQQVGIFPFRFGIGMNKNYTDPVIDQLFDNAGFYAKYGPTTLEKRNKYYVPLKGECCYWNGNSWPYSTAHSLMSMAEMYRNVYNRAAESAAQYMEYLKIYTATHSTSGSGSGVPYIAESHFQDLDAWSASTLNHSEHYMHSTFTDNVLTGLMGIVPSLEDELMIDPIMPDNWTYFAVENLYYHGYKVDIFYDRDGKRYKGKKKGLSVYSDNKLIHNGNDRTAMVSFDKAKKVDRRGWKVNIATNPTNYEYPKINSTFENGWVQTMIDGVVFYDQCPSNRWVTNQWVDSETVTLEFARERKLSSVMIATYSDVHVNGVVDCPSSIDIESDHGVVKTKEWKCTPNSMNTIEFVENVDTKSLHFTFNSKKDKSVGICEIEAWVDGPPYDKYYAVDGLLAPFSGTVVKNEDADSGYAVSFNNGTDNESLLEFGGVVVDKEGTKNVTVRYSSNSNSNSNSDQTAFVSVNNQVDIAGSPIYNEYDFSMPDNNNKFTTKTLQLDLKKGWNYITFRNANITYDYIKLEE